MSDSDSDSETSSGSEVYSESDQSSEESGSDSDSSSGSDSDSDSGSDSDSKSRSDSEVSDIGSDSDSDNDNENEEVENEGEKAMTVKDQEAAQRIQKAFRSYKKRKDALLDFDPNDLGMSREEMIERAVRVLLAPDIEIKAPSLTGLPFKPSKRIVPKWYSLVGDSGRTDIQYPAIGSWSLNHGSSSSVQMVSGQHHHQLSPEMRMYDNGYRQTDRYHIDPWMGNGTSAPNNAHDLNMMHTRYPPPSPPPPPLNHIQTTRSRIGETGKLHHAMKYSGFVISNPYSTRVDPKSGGMQHYDQRMTVSTANRDLFQGYPFGETESSRHHVPTSHDRPSSYHAMNNG